MHSDQTPEHDSNMKDWHVTGTLIFPVSNSVVDDSTDNRVEDPEDSSDKDQVGTGVQQRRIWNHAVVHVLQRQQEAVVADSQFGTLVCQVASFVLSCSCSPVAETGFLHLLAVWCTSMVGCQFCAMQSFVCV